MQPIETSDKTHTNIYYLAQLIKKVTCTADIKRTTDGNSHKLM